MTHSRLARETPIAVIGVGKIGEAIVRALLKAGFGNVIGTVRTKRRQEQLRGLRIPVLLDNRKAIKGAEVVFLCVKPHQVPGVLRKISDLLAGKLLISVAAAVRTDYLETLAPGARVVRAMPNINITVGHSATAITPGRTASEEDLAVTKELFDLMGYCVVVEERYMDAITAYSGSGPAFAFIFFEALLLAGLKVGLPRDIALELAIHTLTGTAKLLEATKAHPAELRDMVITPGGVTIEGVHVLERAGFRAIIMDAVNETYRKAADIARALNSEARE